MSKIKKRFRIQEYERNGFTQIELSKKLGIPQPNISKYANSERQMFVEISGEDARLIDDEPRVFGRGRKKVS